MAPIDRSLLVLVLYAETHGSLQCHQMLCNYVYSCSYSYFLSDSFYQYRKEMSFCKQSTVIYQRPPIATDQHLFIILSFLNELESTLDI